MERLLVVEHNRLFGEGLALLLEWRTGLSSTHAHALDEAKSVLEEADWKPACIIVDLDLPEGGRDRIAQGTGWDTGTGAHQEQKRGTPGRGDRTGSGRGATYDRVGREDSRSGGAAHRPLDLLLLGALMTQGALPLATSEDCSPTIMRLIRASVRKENSQKFAVFMGSCRKLALPEASPETSSPMNRRSLGCWWGGPTF